MTISIIAALAENNVIGNDNKLIWHISEDLKRFKKLTSGKPIIMGRKTYNSLPIKPLPKRKNIVISRNKNLDFEGAVIVSDIDKALTECENAEEVFICGGAEIYKMFLPLADKMYLTRVHKNYKGDTVFPETDYSQWKLIDEIKVEDNPSYSFLNYKKIK